MPTELKGPTDGGLIDSLLIIGACADELRRIAAKHGDDPWWPNKKPTINDAVSDLHEAYVEYLQSLETVPD